MKGHAMTEHVLFLQGAGTGAYDEDKALADSLQTCLGQHYEVHYPRMPNEEDAPYEQWRQFVEDQITRLPGRLVVAGHSVGASVLIKWLTERQDERAIAGAFLAACAYWGGDGWRYEGYEELELKPEAAANLQPDIPIYLYHCRDDEVVPFAHLALWARDLPQATVRVLETGGHQFNNDLSTMARDIASAVG
jgi:predicted alpha/beta hydrolase family esterase